LIINITILYQKKYINPKIYLIMFIYIYILLCSIVHPAKIQLHQDELLSNGIRNMNLVLISVFMQDY